MSSTIIYKNYTASVIYDTEDDVLVGRVMNIDDVITFHAASIPELKTAMSETVEDYLQACESLGQTANKPASGKLMLRIAPEVHASALRAASNARQSLNKWAEQVLLQAASPSLR